MHTFSIIIPVYNRPEEVDELLHSLTLQTLRKFEVVLVEDGSTKTCKHLVDVYSTHFAIQYIFKPNSGPGPSRNLGFAQAKGDYLVVFDSDCIIPPDYLSIVQNNLLQHGWDAYGGPDKAHQDFTLLQKAMGYTMASFLTTGGIRGGKQHVGSFQPRSFNMGLSRKAYELTGGFRFDRYAEDIELSIRLKAEGLKVGLIPEAFVYHKRRTNLRQFYKQVFNFGRGRVLIGKQYSQEVKLTHWIPLLFTLALVAWLLTLFTYLPLFKLGSIFFALYFGAIMVGATIAYKNVMVGLMAIPSALVQLVGYGLGFFVEKLK
ncbi:glycosyltransferase [Chryseotalea sanaruensis]|uniref:Glycosyltransferase n=1 Tax=Chryseotalea sanaruensis TaxID=2482724 RepID=A0A401U932_9BACT|nr:glycosyltransferase [Chryseotalea sanaruensis]GCC51413.1 glycosyltransferase [Chryseotalea sanaruensis]